MIDRIGLLLISLSDLAAFCIWTLILIAKMIEVALKMILRRDSCS